MKLNPANPKPGIYENVPREVYDRLPGWNYSTLKEGLPPKTLAHLKAVVSARAKGVERPDTAAFLVGRAFEDYLYDRKAFDAKYVVAPEGFRSNATVKFKDFIESAAGREILTLDQREQIQAMYDGLCHNRDALKLLLGPGKRQVVVVGEIDGTLCKGCIDKLNDDGTLIDLKTARKEHDAAFWYAVRDYRYDMQMAMYSTLLEQEGLRVWVVQGKGFPYLVNTLIAPRDMLLAAQSELRMLLMRIRSAEQTGEWPGYGGLHTLEPPVNGSGGASGGEEEEESDEPQYAQVEF